MIQEYTNHSLRHLNTFGFDVKAQKFITYSTAQELTHILSEKVDHQSPLFILGGGSNLLFTGNYSGLILKSHISGIREVKRSSDSVWIEAGAGVVWDDLVAWAVSKNFYGLENLSYIPGSVGAAPIQNIGAYGMEAKDVIDTVYATDIQTATPFQLTNQECSFNYRHSRFKESTFPRSIVTKVLFKLSLKPCYHLDYGNLSSALDSYGSLTLQNVRKAIVAIRKSKLPDPQEVGNAGSFFKNPIISKAHYEQLKSQHERIPCYELPCTTEVKVPAGWLIEHAGWKGRTQGRAAVHTHQALVLINRGGATPSELLHLAHSIVHDVKQQFGITLEREVETV